MSRLERFSAESAVQAQTTAMGDQLEGELRARVRAVRLLARRWESTDRPALGEWRSDAQLLLAEQPGFRAVAWIDPTLEFRSVVGARGRAVDTASVRRAVHGAGIGRPEGGGSARGQALSPVGGAALVTAVPIYRGSEFRGWVASVIDVSALLEAVWPRSSGSERSITLVDERGVVYERLGPAGPGWSAATDVGFAGVDWELRVAPGPELAAQIRPPFRRLTLVLVLFGAALLVIAVGLAQQARRRARRLAEVNRALEEQVADRRVAEAVAAEALKRLEAVFRASPLAIIALDKDGWVTSWNAAAERMFGWKAEEVVGERFPVLMSGDEGEALLPWERVLEGRYPATIDVRAVTRQGSPVDVRVWSAPVTDAAGEVTGVMVVAEDVQERRRLERQLLQAQRMESVGRLAGGVAHDFNNVLTAILGHTEIALNELAPDAPMREDLEQVKKAAERAAALTRQLLAFGRQQVLQPRVMDLNEVVADIEKLLRRLIGEHIDLRTVLDPHLGPVRADPAQIEQVIMNLAVNARDAMPEGGTLTIETANVDILEGYVQEPVVLEPGRYVMLRVIDTGVGMDEATRHRAFEPFFTTKEAGKGTGLGLATVYGIVQQSGGHVAIESEVGQGTTVSVYLPRVDEPVERPESVAVPEAVVGGKETVLLVEDDDGVRRLASLVLSRNGYTVLQAATPTEALAIVREQARPVDLLLADVVMPEMSGRGLAERLRPFCPSLKVLYMSGYMDKSLAVTDAPEVLERLLPKPFTSDSLLRAVRRALDA